MKAFVYEYGEHKWKEMPDPTPGPNEVVVNMKVAGLNRRDLYIAGRMGPDKPALILGSDGAGIIEAVGEQVTNVSVGDEVIINPSLRWEKNTPAPPKEFEILGMPDHGTFAEKVVIDAKQVEKKPDYLTWEEAGVLVLAGLTGYRAMFTKGNLQKGETVFIPGAGSGVATFMIQFAKAKGARVIVTSRDEEKRNKALEIGADRAIDTASDWNEALKDESIDLVIESVGEATFNRSLAVLKPGGRIVTFGATAGDFVTLNIREFFYGQYQLFGSTMGSCEELLEMLAFMKEHQLKPVVGHVFPAHKLHDALEFLKVNHQFGKIAIVF